MHACLHVIRLPTSDIGPTNWLGPLAHMLSSLCSLGQSLNATRSAACPTFWRGSSHDDHACRPSTSARDGAAADSLTGASVCTAYHKLFTVSCAVALTNRRPPAQAVNSDLLLSP